MEDSNSLNCIPVSVDSDVEEFYNLLKASIKGRVINGTMDGCILESELKEIYEQLSKLGL